MKAFRTAAVAGVIALGVSAIMATPAQANGRPVLQQLPMPASGLCADVVAATTLNLSGVASGGWTGHGPSGLTVVKAETCAHALW